MNYKKLFFISVLCIVCVVGLSALLVFLVDPCFRFRAPSSNLSYILFDSGKQNMGIAEHFTYDSLIAGNSMAIGFKTSKFDQIFNVKSVNLAEAASYLTKQHDYVAAALGSGNNVQMVLWCLDYYALLQGYTSSDEQNITLNGVRYILNIDMFVSSVKVVVRTLFGIEPDSFDLFTYYYDREPGGKAVLDSKYNRSSSRNNTRQRINGSVTENLSNNVVNLVKNNPETTFYIIFSPVSIYTFDEFNNSGSLNTYLATEEALIRELLNYDNVKIFSFFLNEELITNLDNYIDPRHYNGSVNTKMLEWMHEGRYQITNDNVDQYCNQEWEFFNNYDYDSLF